MLRENLQIEVNELDAIVDRYQQRYNIIGSVSKAFYQETALGKHYKYLNIECAILYFENREFRFMDWLLERQRYMNFTEMLPEYLAGLRTKNLYHPIITKITEEVWKRLQSDSHTTATELSAYQINSETAPISE